MKSRKKCEIALACSGLGHVRRGNETWARTVADSLHGYGANIRLLGGGTMSGVRCPYWQLWNIPRDWIGWRHFLPWARRYAWEQQSFAWSLTAHLRREPVEVLHLADPVLAYRMLLQSRSLDFELVYKDGLLLGPAWWRQFRWVQVLAPQYRDEAIAMGVAVDGCHVIPHMVDINAFSPASDKESAKWRLLGDDFSQGGMVVLAAGDFAAQSSKRIDWVINEFRGAKFNRPSCLVLAGQASAADLHRIKALCAPMGNRIRLMPNTPPGDMPKLFAAADVFVHAALREPFGIVLIEAMACGVPVIGHGGHAVTGWIIGDGGTTVDMRQPGALAAQMSAWAAETSLLVDLGGAARQRVVDHFSLAAIVPLYRQLYQAVGAG